MQQNLAVIVDRAPIVPRYICSLCDRRHSTRTVIGQLHIEHARPKR